jgi:hypothetical protein
MRPNDMLHRWFVNDASTASQDWRLKRHGIEDFWDWVSSWAQCVSSPQDLGFDGSEYDLPKMNIIKNVIKTDMGDDDGDTLFRMPTMSSTGLHKEKKKTITDRAAHVAALIAKEPNEPWVIWCDADYEADALRASIPSAVEVRGSMKNEVKERNLEAFATMEKKILITKPRIAGFGLNWQHCARVAFVGVSYSYEAFYQAVRRCWRFGQQRLVDVHVVMAPTESTIWDTVERKAGDHAEMKTQMLAATRRAAGHVSSCMTEYNPTYKGTLPSWLTS